MGEKDKIAFVECSIYNEKGYKIESLICNNKDHPLDYDLLYKFYLAAKANHQKVDDDLNMLLNEIKNPHIKK